MTLPTPKIDTRTYEDIVRETEDLAQELSGWQPPARDGGHDPADRDAGSALVRIFARLAEIAVERINRVPENDFKCPIQP